MKFDILYEQIIKHFLTEGLDATFLRKKHSEAKIISKDTHIAQKKSKLKKLSKELILHILNANYMNILSRYFPNLSKSLLFISLPPANYAFGKCYLHLFKSNYIIKV